MVKSNCLRVNHDGIRPMHKPNFSQTSGFLSSAGQRTPAPQHTPSIVPRDILMYRELESAVY